VLENGRERATLRVNEPASLWPDPAATQILTVGLTAIALHRTDGTRLWTRELPRMRDAIWLSDGDLAVVQNSGIVRLDRTSGEIKAARCGWGFGLSTTALPPTPPIEPICTQLAD
jgi:hypothetical protein